MTLTDWITAQTSALTLAVKAVVTFALLVVIAMNAIKSGLGISRILVTLLVGGLIVWAVLLDGYMAIGRLLARTFGL